MANSYGGEVRRDFQAEAETGLREEERWKMPVQPGWSGIYRMKDRWQNVD